MNVHDHFITDADVIYDKPYSPLKYCLQKLYGSTE